jgi:hypothetical protein
MQFVLSSTCFEHLAFIIRKTVLYIIIQYVMFLMHLCKQSNLLDCLHKCMKTYYLKLHVQYRPPEDEHKMFETCIRQEELN